MTNPSEKALRMAATISEGLNTAAYALLRPPAEDAAKRLASLRTSLENIASLLDELDPTKISGPNGFDVTRLAASARRMLELVAAWDEPPWPTPEPAMAAFRELLYAVGMTEEQVAAMIREATQPPS